MYDEYFHDGVNIIRGTNSSGKSTIADFIFFVLGGDYNKWKPEAERCDYIIAEIEINNIILTLKRAVSNSSRQNMAIYWGALEDARKSVVEGWQEFPFRRSENVDSFSQVLFRALEFPEVKNDNSSNITMHQILRLIYIDQLSSVESLMRDEQFDTPLTRNTVGEVLFGIYDDSLYSDELSLRAKHKELESISRQVDGLIEILGETDQEIEIKKIEATINENKERIQKIQATLDDQTILNKILEDNDLLTVYKELHNNLSFLKNEYSSTLNDAQSLEYEVEDSRRFISSLQKRVDALDESIKTREILGQLPISFCPHCLSPIQPLSEDICSLCKQNIQKDGLSSQALRMRQELLLQIKESNLLLIEKENKLAVFKAALPELNEKTRNAQLRFDETMLKVKTVRDEYIDSLLIKKGELQSEIEFLLKQVKAAMIVENAKSKKMRLGSEIKGLEHSIQTKRAKQKDRIDTAFDKINEYGRLLLTNDLPREEAFQTVKNIQITFTKNTFAVDNRNQFSASSIIYLKNSIHYAIFFAALNLDFFRYPRMIICDNMEDKGMEEKRSQNFQRLIVNLSQKSDVKHQIIFTTSMIDPDLNKSNLCVGHEYNLERKALKFN